VYFSCGDSNTVVSLEILESWAPGFRNRLPFQGLDTTPGAAALVPLRRQLWLRNNLGPQVMYVVGILCGGLAGWRVTFFEGHRTKKKVNGAVEAMMNVYDVRQYCLHRNTVVN
jgi:hypothetical protein